MTQVIFGVDKTEGGVDWYVANLDQGNVHPIDADSSLAAMAEAGPVHRGVPVAIATEGMSDIAQFPRDADGVC